MEPSFPVAVALYRQGQRAEAERAVRQVLDVTPDHADALHLLGVLLLQRGDAPSAAAVLGRAVAVAPGAGAYYSNLAEALRQSGDVPGAVAAARRATELAPQFPDGHNHLGLALQAQGRLGDAAAAFRRAVELRPAFALAHNNLGGALRELGRRAEALVAVREAVRLDPNPTALTHLGQLLLELGQKGEAEEYCTRAVALAPEYPEGLSNLGNVLLARGHLAAAKECYRHALRLRPDMALLHGNLGQVLQQEGNLDAAVACYRQAAALEPASPRFESLWAGALVEREDVAGAIDHYSRALALDPGFPDALTGLGAVWHDRGADERALACFEDALQHKPDHADAHAHLAGVRAERGEWDRAEHHYREAVRHDPDHAGALGALATHFRDKLPDEDVERVRSLLTREHVSDTNRSALHHALAHVCDARKEFRLAAEHAALGNAYRKDSWRRQGKTYSRDDHTAFVSRLMEQFPSTFFDRVRGWGLDTDVPVFVFGLPRSGTTLLEQILGSHPRVFGAGELTVARAVLERVPQWVTRPEPPELCMAHLSPEVVQRAGREHLSRVRALSATATRIVDKMPDNYLWLGFLAAIFPKARLIYSKRDAHDIAVSCWITNFKHLPWACDPEDIAGRITDHRRLMDHWRTVLPVPVLEIEYEQTVNDLEGVARAMIAFCGLEWDPACLAFHTSTRTVRTASLAQVRQPVYTKSVQRWKNYAEPLKHLFDRIDG